MPQFRWADIKLDVALAREVISCRPTKLQEWVEVAGRLSKEFSGDGKAIELKGRGCRERMERLLEKFKAEDSKSLKRSGTEEEYDELAQLLEDIASYQRDVVGVLSQVKKDKRRKETEDKRKAEEMRNAAMTTMSSRKRTASESVSAESSLVSIIDSDEEGIEEVDVLGRGKGKQKRMSKLSAVEMMQTKFDVNSGLRARELELKKEELQLMARKMDREDEDRKRAAEERDQRMEMEKRRMDLEENERKRAAEERERRMQMEFAERKVMLDLLTKLADKGKD